MTGAGHAAALVAAMALGTILLRFLPFFVFRKGTPPYVAFLGRVLPPAIIGMLVVYCLKDVHAAPPRFALPELIAGGAVVALQALRRNALLSILAGTAVYMALIRVMM